jgi:hypothetical protein
MALVPKQWYANATPNERNNYVEIWARKSGLIAWFLALIKVDPTYFMSVCHKQVVYQASSLTGYQKIIVPLDSVSSSFFGYHKPWKSSFAIFLIATALGSLVIDTSRSTTAGMLTMLAGFVIAVLYYFFNKELLIGITDNTGTRYALILKRAVLGNQEINEQQMELVTKIVINAIAAQKARKLVS